MYGSPEHRQPALVAFGKFAVDGAGARPQRRQLWNCDAL